MPGGLIRYLEQLPTGGFARWQIGAAVATAVAAPGAVAVSDITGRLDGNENLQPPARNPRRDMQQERHEQLGEAHMTRMGGNDDDQRLVVQVSSLRIHGRRLLRRSTAP